MCPLDDLTDDERTTLHWIAEGLTDAEIGRRLGLTNRAIVKRGERIREKLGVRNRVEAAVTYHVWAAT